LVRIDGITFQHADAVAVQLGMDLDSPLRLRGAVLYTCKSQKGMGHLYIRIGHLCSEVRAIIPEATDKQIGGVLAELHKDELIILDRKTRPGETAIYEPWLHHVEKRSAEMIQDRLRTARYQDEDFWAEEFSIVGPRTKAVYEGGGGLSKVIMEAVREWSDASTLDLSDAQMQGVFNALCEPVSILTGLPGTGKTTSLLIVVKILRELGVQFQLVAPTGIAAKKLTEATQAVAGTIHRTFSARGSNEEERDATYEGIVGKGDGVQGDGSDQYWGYSEAKPHPAQVLICDESSMLDQNLLYRLLSCTNDNCRLVFVGDAAQLPSVGPGNVLRDLISSKQFPVVSLTEIFRQGDTSDIVFAAHEIHAGRFPPVAKKSDFVLIENAKEGEVLAMVLTIAQRFQEKGFDFQILSPRHSGTVGVTNMNGRLRELLNPQQPGLKELRLDANTVIRENDRVMVVKNNYRDQVFNGDIGRVTRIDHQEKVLIVEINETLPRLVELVFHELSGHIRMAYACTIHKSQGLEYDYVIVPVLPTFHGQLQRNLYYTAITRAKKKVVLVGTAAALDRAIRNNLEDHRNTLFLDRLENMAQMTP
jgi:exodeoxyribonuclease V alpha subunit